MISQCNAATLDYAISDVKVVGMKKTRARDHMDVSIEGGFQVPMCSR